MRYCALSINTTQNVETFGSEHFPPDCSCGIVTVFAALQSTFGSSLEAKVDILASNSYFSLQIMYPWGHCSDIL